MFRKRLSVMAALVRAVKCQTGMPQWITVCSGLIQSTLPQAQWDRMLYGTLQRHETGRPQLNKVCGGLIQTNGAITQQRRMLHSTDQFLAAKDSLQPSEEKVGAFTKIIEAMGFTGPLKYNKWKIKIAALRMYTCCVERTDYEEFFHRCHMPDTLNSWFLIAQLHVWCWRITGDISVGWSGKLHGACIFKNTDLFRKLQEGTFFPNWRITTGNVAMPVVIVGDPTFPLLP
nr:ubiquinol-cytochrome-c reductase complex assembly factor 1 isoform X2 [Chrysemys picta bellii]